MPRNLRPQPKFNLFQKKGEADAYIYLFFHYMENGRTTVRFKKTVPGTKINPKYWNKAQQRASIDRANPTHHIKVNALLDRMAATVEGIYKDHGNGCVSVETMDKEFRYRMEWVARPVETMDKRQTLFGFVESFITERLGLPGSQTKRHKVIFNHLKRYADDRRAGVLDFADINQEFFNDLKKWLFGPPRNHSTNTAAKAVSVLRQFMKEAQRRGLHTKTDYQTFAIPKSKSTKVVLSFEELELLYSLDLSGNLKLDKVRDLFLIGAYTGLRFSDFTRIRQEHIETVEDTEIISITTQKTGQMVSIPLLPIPKAILSKYEYSAPAISNQKMNDYLKELGQLAGMTGKMFITGNKSGKRTSEIFEKWEKITTHVARRSFATNYYKSGTPAIVLMQITGHTTEKQFMEYISIDGQLNAARFADIRQPLKKVAG